MNDTPDPILVLGIGNLLWADEGFGVRCVEAFGERWAVPERVTVLDGGTQGLYLLPYLTAARRLIVFDAIDYGLPPGTLRQVENGEVPRFMGVKKMSLHQTGFQEVLAAAELLGQLPAEMLLIGVQPAELDDYGGSLRPAVRALVPEAVELAAARLRAWGVDLRPAEGARPVLNDDALALAGYEAGRPPAEAAWRLGDGRFHPDAVR
ncbi:HyaD/HybD family hydrogenase maturation endopeptidase [Pseudothauera rhizosphaerae]|uniref:HyaD/HybD family hydrogenase maturation endopeptidase n=1 Tax=Pseudothauera rhizosphaerae TaxID=2565932 RepID=A0A4S4B003_9RHOO|nr:HyaD/HybD family hydrogenase maturation endopeptidase [Pseudothauera rhizosphaerae]THF65329.1 HyaD/HybD family hydrogenase maturation endopeptidase [Pseudothauera rhizosphaerae]